MRFKQHTSYAKVQAQPTQDLRELFENSKVFQPEQKAEYLGKGYTEEDFEVLCRLKPYWEKLKPMLDMSSPVYSGRIYFEYMDGYTEIKVRQDGVNSFDFGRYKAEDGVFRYTLAPKDLVLYQAGSSRSLITFPHPKLFTQYYDCEFANPEARALFESKCLDNFNVMRLGSCTELEPKYIANLQKQCKHVFVIDKRDFSECSGMLNGYFMIKDMSFKVGELPRELEVPSKRIQPLLLAADGDAVRILY